MSIFTGAGVAIITPMNEDGTVNYAKLEEILEFQIAGHTDAIIICGTTGEASTLSDEEHLECIRFTCEKVNKRIPVIAGTGSNCTESAVYLSKEAEKAGVDGLLLVTPYYNKATQNGLKAHYKAIASQVKVPIILYNVPGRTGCNIQPETVATLVRENENIVGLKEATGNMAQASKTMYLCDGKLDLYSGEDGLVVPLMAIGGIGVISVIANIAPQQTHDMCASYMAGDREKALELQMKSLPLVDALFSEVNPIPVKRALNLLGMEVGSLRAPLCEMSDANAAVLKQAMVEYGLL